MPKAIKWYNFWTGESTSGGKTIEADAPIETVPLYVKAGSIVPMGPEIEYATQNPSGAIELRIYPGADGEFKFYEDENDNYNYEKGKYSTFIFKWHDKLHQLSVSDRKGSFQGMLNQHLFNVVVVKDGAGVSGNITVKPNKNFAYHGKAMMINIKY